METAPSGETAPPATDGARDGAVVDLLDAVSILVFAALALVICFTMAEGVYVFLHRAERLSRDQIITALSHNAYLEVIVESLVYAFLLAFMAALVWTRHHTGLLRAIGWNAPERRRALYALILGLATALFSSFAEVLLQPWTPKSLPINEFFRDRLSAFVLAGFGTLVAPFVEELVFRGFLYPALARWIGRFFAVIVTAAGFALIHGAQLAYSWAPLVVLFIVGLVLTCARVVTRSVAFTVLLHMGYNFTLFFVLFIETQGFRNFQG